MKINQLELILSHSLVKMNLLNLNVFISFILKVYVCLISNWLQISFHLRKLLKFRGLFTLDCLIKFHAESLLYEIANKINYFGNMCIDGHIGISVFSTAKTDCNNFVY